MGLGLLDGLWMRPSRADYTPRETEGKERRREMGARRHRVDTKLTLNRYNSLAGFLPGDPGAFFTGFGQANSDGLLAAFHASALAAFAGTERAAFSSAHGARDVFPAPPLYLRREPDLLSAM